MQIWGKFGREATSAFMIQVLNDFMLICILRIHVTAYENNFNQQVQYLEKQIQQDDEDWLSEGSGT